jgi:hypothetical protein
MGKKPEKKRMENVEEKNITLYKEVKNILGWMKEHGRYIFLENGGQGVSWYEMKEEEVEAMVDEYYEFEENNLEGQLSLLFNPTSRQRGNVLVGKKRKGEGNGGEKGRRRGKVCLNYSTEGVFEAVAGTDGKNVFFGRGIVSIGTGRYRGLIEKKYEEFEKGDIVNKDSVVLQIVKELMDTESRVFVDMNTKKVLTRDEAIKKTKKSLEDKVRNQGKQSVVKRGDAIGVRNKISVDAVVGKERFGLERSSSFSSLNSLPGIEGLQRVPQFFSCLKSCSKCNETESNEGEVEEMSARRLEGDNDDRENENPNFWSTKSWLGERIQKSPPDVAKEGRGVEEIFTKEFADSIFTTSHILVDGDVTKQGSGGVEKLDNRMDRKSACLFRQLQSTEREEEEMFAQLFDGDKDDREIENRKTIFKRVILEEKSPRDVAKEGRGVEEIFTKEFEDSIFTTCNETEKNEVEGKLVHADVTKEGSGGEEKLDNRMERKSACYFRQLPDFVDDIIKRSNNKGY